MNKLIFLFLAVGLLMAGCRSQEMAAVEEQPVQEVEEVVEVEAVVEEEVIPVREERFTFDNTEDEVTHDENTYFVIMGSFRMRDNAERFMGSLRGLGFEPVILLSETGYHRISVNSYDEESPARTRIHHIRNNYPEYYDTWLLIRKP